MTFLILLVLGGGGYETLSICIGVQLFLEIPVSMIPFPVWIYLFPVLEINTDLLVVQLGPNLS